LGNSGETGSDAFRVSQPLPLHEAIQALKRDPTHPVRVRVDEELTVEVRAVGEETPSQTIGDLLFAKLALGRERPAPISTRSSRGSRVTVACLIFREVRALYERRRAAARQRCSCRTTVCGCRYGQRWHAPCGAGGASLRCREVRASRAQSNAATALRGRRTRTPLRCRRVRALCGRARRDGTQRTTRLALFAAPLVPPNPGGWQRWRRKPTQAHPPALWGATASSV
jgi:hypothetical protein